MPSNAPPPIRASLLDSFTLRLRKTRSPNTAVAYGKVARAFLVRFPDAVPDLRRVEEFITVSAAGRVYAITTRNHRLAALRALGKHAVAEGCWAQDPTVQLEFVKAPPRDPPVLSMGEVQRMFEALEGFCSPRQLAQHRAVLALLFTLGLRVHELVGLNVDQIDVPSSTLINVHGKGGTVHDLPLEPSTLELLQKWLAERSLQAEPEENALFVSKRGTRTSTRWVQRLFRKLRPAIGTQKRITPHTARHSAATLALMAGADVSSIGELLRHSDINVTRRYIRLVDVRKRQVTELLSRVIPAPLRAPFPPPNGAGGLPLPADGVPLPNPLTGTGSRFSPAVSAFTSWPLTAERRVYQNDTASFFPLVTQVHFPDVERGLDQHLVFGGSALKPMPTQASCG